MYCLFYSMTFFKQEINMPGIRFINMDQMRLILFKIVGVQVINFYLNCSDYFYEKYKMTAGFKLIYICIEVNLQDELRVKRSC